MRTKLNILMCTLFVLGFAVTQLQAQYAYRLGARHRTVAQYGNNQMVGDVYLMNIDTEANAENTDVARNQEAGMDKVDISFGGLTITNSSITPQCAADLTDAGFEGGACDTGTTVAINDDKDTATITVNAADNTDNIRLTGVRLNVSGLDVDAQVAASLSSAGAGGINFGSGAGVSAARHVATVKAGLSFAITHANQLYCSGEGATQPSLKVTEGFASAWESAGDFGSTNIHFKILNIPAGVTFIWPGQDHDDAMGAPEVRMNVTEPPAGGFTEAAPGDNTLVAMLEFVPAGLSSDTSEAVYKFVPTDFTAGEDLDGAGDGTATAQNAVDHTTRADTFELKLVTAIDAAKAGTGGTADIWGWLHPAAGFEDLGTKLSYTMHPQTQDTNEDEVIDEDDGDILTVSECVTYLLYPFVTCGSTAGWSTGMSVANTTMDDDVFGEKKGAAPQAGSVTLFGYPKSAKAADGSSGETGDAVMMMLSPNLAAGDTIATACPMVTEGGWEGYAIVRAAFRHAHGMAFVIGNMDGGAADVAHGYMALVVPDPQFTEGVRGTEISESLGQ